MERFLKVKYIFILIGLILIYIGYILFFVDGKVTCKRFKTQQEAQQAFNKNRERLAKLDKDHDGIPCERR